MKNFLLGVLFTLVVLVFGAILYLRLGFAQVRADLPPPKWEIALLRGAVHASVARRAPEMASPVAPTDENLIAGGRMYLDNCSGCHGAPGKPEELGDSLYPPIPQFPIVGTELTEAQIFWVTKHGIRYSGMFANGKFHSDDKMWTMAAYLKRIRNIPEHVKEELAKPEKK